MSGKMARNKGQRGEREIIAILQPILEEEYAAKGLPCPKLERNLQQSASGGHDIKGLEWLALEIKRQESLNFSKAWEQARKQALQLDKINRSIGYNKDSLPILAYRANFQPWGFAIIAKIPIGNFSYEGLAILNLSDFIEYFRLQIRAHFPE